MKKSTLFLAIITSAINLAFSQGTAINSTGAPADPSAMLDVSGTNSGVLINRLTTTQRNAITSPAEGLQIFNISTKCLDIYANGLWQSVFCSCTPPSAPTEGTHTPETDQIIWDWSDVSGATGYQWNTTSAYPGAGVNEVSGSDYTQTGLSSNTDYTLYVWAYNACGISNMTTLTETTKGGYSVDFASGNYVRVPMSSSLSNFQYITVEFWYYETAGHGSDEAIIGTEYFAGNHFSIYSYKSGFYFSITDASNNTMGYLDIPAHNGIVYNTYTWYHVALTYDGSELRFYLNGQLQYSETGTLGLFGPTNQDLVINRHTWDTGSSSRLTGQMDELRISNISRYNSDFTPPQGKFTTDGNTSGLWHFDEGSGSQVIDVSGNGNNGSVVNGAGWSTNIP